MVSHVWLSGRNIALLRGLLLLVVGSVLAYLILGSRKPGTARFQTGVLERRTGICVFCIVNVLWGAKVNTSSSRQGEYITVTW
jgi:hypothetical protein